MAFAARLRRGSARWLAAGICAVIIAPILWSYGRALTSPGTDSLSIRSVEWIRGHGGATTVNTIEAWWYSHHQPKKGAPAPAIFHASSPQASPSTSAAVAAGPSAPVAKAKAAASGHHYTAPVAHLPAPTPVVPFASPPAPGEGVWQPAGAAVRGVPAVYTTALRPDSVHTGLATGVAWMDPTLLRAVLYAGHQEPGGAWQHEAPVPVDQRAALVAAFNGGFRVFESRGGYYSESRTARPLVNGAASLVITADGRATVGEWGRDVTLTPDVASVRQNLALIVDNHQLVPGLDNNTGGRWGRTVGNRILVWRSGVGVTDNGALVYAAGDGLSASSLAQVLRAAGAARAMELDINSNWTRFFTYDGGAGGPLTVTGTRLVPGMRSSPGLYFEPESRDFVAMMAR